MNHHGYGFNLLTWEILYPNHQDYPAAAAAALPVWIRRRQTV